ncbi:MAG: pyridoxine 5'-phosphate synthase, partial [Rickettsiales bacterium]
CEDRRHIRDVDMHRLKAEVALPLNFEMAATEEMLKLALAIKPNACCLVPEKREERTTEGGLDVAGQEAYLLDYCAKLKESGIRTSLFIDPVPEQLQAAARLGSDIVELHTGAYAAGRNELPNLQRAAKLAHSLGLEVHAGHGLTFDNVGPITAIPELVELNIGHFLIGEAVMMGLPEAIRQMRHRMDEARP